MNTKKQQTESDKSFLYKLLTQEPERKKLGLIDYTFIFLSHGSWQGIGAILGLLSLMVSITLTLYVFNITRQQQDAVIKIGHVSSFTPDKKFEMRGIVIGNQGPAMAEGVVVAIEFSKGVSDCYVDPEISTPFQTRRLAVVPSKVTHSHYYCVVAFDYFPPQQEVVVWIDDLVAEDNEPKISVSGANISYYIQGHSITKYSE